MPVQIGRHQPAALPDSTPRSSTSAGLPVSRQQRAEQFEGPRQGTTLPGTRQSTQTEPPAATEKNRFGSGSPHFAQALKLGA